VEPPADESAIAEVVERLGELRGEPARVVGSQSLHSRTRPDALIRVGDDLFVLEWKRSSGSSSVAGAIEQLTRFVQHYTGEGHLTPLIAMPYMPPAARDLASDRGISWLDLSGNARIRTRQQTIHIEGKPNRFKERGRPSTPFAPKSARITRWLLINHPRQVTQQEIAEQTDVDPGQVSRVIQRLLANSLIRRDDDGTVFAPDPDLLLDAWRSEYDFEKHSIQRGHIASRSGSNTMMTLAHALNERAISHAATGLASAWLQTHFAAFRLVTFYVSVPVPGDVLAQVGFRPEERGSNVWFATPNDTGVFEGVEPIEGVRCVHPVQTYLDLKSHPERAPEAAEELRHRLLRWPANDQ